VRICSEMLPLLPPPPRSTRACEMARDPEFWFPAYEAHVGRVGRPKTHTVRLLEDFPPPTPQPTLCRIWQGAVDSDGYAVRTTHHDNKRRRVYRWIWEMANGPIPKGLVVRHRCDNRVCYRLSHLELGTVAENNRDAADRHHLGPPRVMPPSVVVAIWERHEAGEPYTKIALDFPEFSLATVKRAKDYIDDARATLQP
jgi:HNH endonuclease